MSSKRYLLSILFLLIVLGLTAQFSFQSSTDLRLRTGDPNAWGLVMDTGIYAPIDQYSYIEVTNLLDWWDRATENRNAKTRDHFTLGYVYNEDSLEYGLSYYGTFFKDATPIFIEFDPTAPQWAQYSRKAIHQANLDLNYRLGQLNASADANLRLVKTEPHLLFGSPDPQPESSLFDNYITAAAGYQLIPELAVNAELNYKTQTPYAELIDSSRDSESYALRTGLAFNKDFGTNILSLDIRYQKQDWDNMPEALGNQFISELHYNHSFGPYLNGFLSFINRSSLYEDELCLLANYARAQIKYSLPSDELAGSYVLLGAKLRPANDAAFHPDCSAYFGECNFLLVPNLYLGAALNLAPEIQNQYSARLSYRVDQNSELHLDFIGRQSRRNSASDKDFHSLFGIGTELVF